MESIQLKKLVGNDKIYARDLNNHCINNFNSDPRNVYYCPSNKQASGLALYDYDNDNDSVKLRQIRSERIPRNGDMYCETNKNGITLKRVNSPKLPIQHTSINITIPYADNESGDESDDDIPDLVENFSDCGEHNSYKNTDEEERKQNEISNEIMNLLNKELDNNK